MKTVCGESASAPVEVSSEWQKNKLSKLLQEYSAENIFNADERGNYETLHPDKRVTARSQILQDYLQINNDIAATEEITFQEIATKEHNDTEQVDCDDQPEEDAPETVTNKKAEEAMETLRLFLQQQEGAGDILL
ncbi:tigger transposable element-derived protein 6 [Plakobranchus ocellatus]|uniref:Tigger transposable element-derived protein 6 n=1 Tax=Plakobranchus ocellatus TaxID=259542 RepID=A0AAV4E0F3_9GAST|nr:tigger transposable element-derived protein 6 [Plakobranchus ocellatus]